MKTYLSRDRRHRIAAKSKEVIAILHTAVKEFLADNCLHLAASISYYLFFCIFPLSLAFISVLGFISGSPESEARVIEAIGNSLPVSSELITSSIQGVIRSRGTTGAIATIGLLWGGSAVFNVIRKSLNIAWGVKKPRPFFVERAMELGMTLGVGLLLLISIGITTALSVIQRFNATVLGIEFLNGAVFWQASLMLLSISLAFVTFLLLYKFVPYTRVQWRDVWGGALLAAVGFEATKQVFVWYATNFAHHNLIYGPVGTIIALLIWTYISAVIVLFCAKLTSVYSKSRRSAIEFSTWKGRRRTNNRRHSFDHLAVDGASSLHRHN
ncbi:YihY/virulence factor BrkB family protein [Dehalococcoidia bacterium]|nr:YihY/virulence factor BrkB family protein [Dehalococcoidia bacterium]MCL0082761.1 YihY/virulence factor BrkB family protein [Dehalococcoidia bacterium]